MTENDEIYWMTESLKSFLKSSPKIAKLDRSVRIEVAKTLLQILEKINVIDGHDQGFLFKEAEKMNIHILRPDYYSALPLLQELYDKPWTNSELVGIDLNVESQLELLSLFTLRFKNEYEKFLKDPPSSHVDYYLSNGLFESVDAEILYCMIRFFKPRKIIEVGAGFTTLLSAKAVLQNEIEDPDYTCRLIAIEPYPRDFLQKGVKGLSELIQKKIQDVPVSFFEHLSENDILFIDSSHVLKVGSDVQYEYLEILPRLKKGVIVHSHDIFLPAEYPKIWVIENKRFWSEQYLLQAFLMFNETFKVLWAGSYMHLHYPDRLEIAFPSYDRTKRWPGSFWMQKEK